MFILMAVNVSESSFTVEINIIKDNACSKAGIVVNELLETFSRAKQIYISDRVLHLPKLKLEALLSIKVNAQILFKVLHCQLFESLAINFAIGV